MGEDWKVRMDEMTVEWDANRWKSAKRRAAECVELTGALLKHPDEDRAYIAPEPTEWAVVFEVYRDDIVDAFSIDESRSKGGVEYPIVQTLLKRNSTVSVTGIYEADEIPALLASLRGARYPRDPCLPNYGPIARPTNGDPEPSPSPSPSPTPRPSGPRPVASGVRG